MASKPSAMAVSGTKNDMKLRNEGTELPDRVKSERSRNWSSST